MQVDDLNRQDIVGTAYDELDLALSEDRCPSLPAPAPNPNPLPAPAPLLPPPHPTAPTPHSPTFPNCRVPACRSTCPVPEPTGTGYRQIDGLAACGDGGDHHDGRAGSGSWEAARGTQVRGRIPHPGRGVYAYHGVVGGQGPGRLARPPAARGPFPLLLRRPRLPPQPARRLQGVRPPPRLRPLPAGQLSGTQGPLPSPPSFSVFLLGRIACHVCVWEAESAASRLRFAAAPQQRQRRTSTAPAYCSSPKPMLRSLLSRRKPSRAPPSAFSLSLCCLAERVPPLCPVRHLSGCGACTLNPNPAQLHLYAPCRLLLLLFRGQKTVIEAPSRISAKQRELLQSRDL